MPILNSGGTGRAGKKAGPSLTQDSNHGRNFMMMTMQSEVITQQRCRRRFRFMTIAAQRVTRT